MKKVALFGGSFDPFHTDHLNIIKACHDDLKFDEVWIILTYLNPFKVSSSSSVIERLEMIELGIKNLDYAKIKLFEIKKQTKTYTYDTITHYKLKYPEIHFSFIMGSDQLDNFEKWYKFSELIKKIEFFVFLREEHYNKKIVNKYQLKTFIFENNYLSSTKIRNLIDVPLQLEQIKDYINENLMYLHERLQIKMDEKRYIHSLHVGIEALKLAKLNNYKNPNQALVAGVLHDIAKRWTDSELEQIICEFDKNLLKEPKPVWHSFAGAFHLKRDWLLNDDEIINAVFKHSVADIKMSVLDMIVFCADKISSERNYEGLLKLRKETYKDLKTGFKLILKHQYDFAVKKNGKYKIGDMIIKSYNHWIGES